MLRILSVSVGLPSEEADWWRIRNLEAILRRAGHEVVSVHYFNKKIATLNHKYGSPSVDEFVPTTRLTAQLNHLQVIGNRHYDLVLGNNHAATFVSLLGRFRGVPLVFDAHADIVEEARLTEPHLRFHGFPVAIDSIRDGIIDFLDLRLADMITCVSRRMMDHFVSKGTSVRKLRYVPNGVDVAMLQSVPKPDVLNLRRILRIEDRLVFGYLGGTQKWQGLEQLVTTAKQIRDSRAFFLIVGAPSDSRERNIQYIPRVTRGIIPLYYGACDVLVLPRPKHLATEVAAPTKFAEYAAAGKPILVTDVGDAADHVRDYRCGIVISDNSVQSMSQGIYDFLALPESNLRLMGRNSKNLAEAEFSWERIGSQFLAAVRSVVQDR